MSDWNPAEMIGKNQTGFPYFMTIGSQTTLGINKEYSSDIDILKAPINDNIWRQRIYKRKEFFK